MFYYKYHSFTTTTVSVEKPWLICGYHGLTITKVFLLLFFFVVKPWLGPLKLNSLHHRHGWNKPDYLIVDYRFFMKMSASQIQFIWQNNAGFSHM